MKNNEEKGSKKNRHEKRTLLLSLGLLIIGSAGYFLSPRGLPIFYAFAHLGALGILGLTGSVAGILARKKHRDYWLAFFQGAVLPIILGIVAVLIFWWVEEGQLYCGGSVSLAVAVLVVSYYLITKKKTPPRQYEKSLS